MVHFVLLAGLLGAVAADLAAELDKTIFYNSGVVTAKDVFEYRSQSV